MISGGRAQMKPTAVFVALAFGLLLHAKDKIVWNTGTVTDSSAALTHAAPTPANPSGEFTDRRTVIDGVEFRYEINDTVAKSDVPDFQGWLGVGHPNHGRDCRFIVGKLVLYRQEKNKLRVLDADGKQCLLDIARQETIKK
jgi:hypothetical protein